MSGLDAGSFPTSAGRARRSDSSTKMVSRTRGQWAGRPLVLEEGLLRAVLLREKKRAERFEQPFVLVLVRGEARSADRPTWSLVTEALAAVKRDTDVLGWYERESVLAMILPEIDSDDPQF